MAMKIQIKNDFHEVVTFHGTVDYEYNFTVEMTTYFMENKDERTTFKFHWHKVNLKKGMVDKAEKRIEKMLLAENEKRM